MNNELVTPIMFDDHMVFIHHKDPKTGECINGDHEIKLDLSRIQIICRHTIPNYKIIKSDFYGLKSGQKEYIFPKKQCTLL